MTGTVAEVFGRDDFRPLTAACTPQVEPFPHLSPDQYLAFCEETGLIPKFLIDKTIALLDSWPRADYDKDTKEELKYYVEHTLRLGQIWPSVLICTLIYMDRGKDMLLVQHRQGLWRRAHLFGAALMVAGKVLMDNTYNLRSWCRLVSISAPELLHMEVAFLRIVNFDLSINDEVVREYLSKQMPPCITSNGSANGNRANMPVRSKSIRGPVLQMSIV